MPYLQHSKKKKEKLHQYNLAIIQKLFNQFKDDFKILYSGLSYEISRDNAGRSQHDLPKKPDKIAKILTHCLAVQQVELVLDQLTSKIEISQNNRNNFKALCEKLLQKYAYDMMYDFNKKEQTSPKKQTSKQAALEKVARLQEQVASEIKQLITAVQSQTSAAPTIDVGHGDQSITGTGKTWHHVHSTRPKNGGEDSEENSDVVSLSGDGVHGEEQGSNDGSEEQEAPAAAAATSPVASTAELVPTAGERDSEASSAEANVEDGAENPEENSDVVSLPGDEAPDASQDSDDEGEEQESDEVAENSGHSRLASSRAAPIMGSTPPQQRTQRDSSSSSSSRGLTARSSGSESTISRRRGPGLFGDSGSSPLVTPNSGSSVASSCQLSSSRPSKARTTQQKYLTDEIKLKINSQINAYSKFIASLSMEKRDFLETFMRHVRDIEDVTNTTSNVVALRQKAPGDLIEWLKTQKNSNDKNWNTAVWEKGWLWGGHVMADLLAEIKTSGSASCVAQDRATMFGSSPSDNNTRTPINRRLRF